MGFYENRPVLTGNHAAAIVDGPLQQGITRIEIVLRFQVDDERNKVARYLWLVARKSLPLCLNRLWSNLTSGTPSGRPLRTRPLAVHFLWSQNRSELPSAAGELRSIYSAAQYPANHNP